MNLLSGLAAKLSRKTSSAFTNVQSMELAGVSVLNALQALRHRYVVTKKCDAWHISHSC